MKIKLVRDCPFRDLKKAWNEGFQDYAFHVQMTSEQIISTMASKHLSVDHSFVAYDDMNPIGLILNSVQYVDGKKMSYNGGTAVHPDYRKRGVGHQLIDASLDLLKKEGVEIATLEAISTNHGAIKLYESFGYQVTDRLSTLRTKLKSEEQSGQFRLRLMSLSEWRGWQIDQSGFPWQNKIPFISEPEIYAIEDQETPVGYIILSKPSDRHLTIFQLQALTEEISYLELLRSVCVHFPGHRAVAFNVPQHHPSYKCYQYEGVEQTIEQVWMNKIF
ncbi:GNAT family N-acetyltransferase [Halobacillus fulvus]|nr:GNAT family N-acetyltransferase [Halobacillus fulvus]